MKKILLLILIMFAGAVSIQAQHDSHWTTVTCEDQEPVVAYVQMDGSYVNVSDNFADIEVAAFVDGVCRGHSFMVDETSYGDLFPTVNLAVYYNVTGEEVSFMMYDHGSGILYDDCTSNVAIHTGEDHTELWFDPNDAVVLSFTSSTSPSTTVLLNETFESYTVGNKVASEASAMGNDWWTTWSNSPGGSEDGVVADYSGNQCAHLTFGNDQVLLLGNVDNGNYDLDFDILVPNGKSGYFNILHNFSGSGSSWAMQCYLHLTTGSNNNPGHGTVMAGGQELADIPCVYDGWMHFRLNIDTDADVARYFYTAPGGVEQLMCTWQWSYSSTNAHSESTVLSAMNFYPPSTTSEYYLDNFTLTRIPNVAYYSINATADPTDGGVIQGYGEYAEGETCRLIANANTGYEFVHWVENNVVVSEERVYSFPVTGNRSLTAVFQSEANAPELVLITNYDLQTNAALSNRVATWDDGTAAFVAMMDRTNSTSFSGRGTGYNYYDGTNLQPIPDERIETIKSGWPSIAPLGNGEILASHDAYGVNIYKRATKGEGDWTKIHTFSDSDWSWPRIATTHDGQYVHVLLANYNGSNTSETIIKYARSTDGGNSWSDPIDLPLVGLEGDYLYNINADGYQFATNGDKIAILLGDFETDLFYIYSEDNGDSWTKQIVAPFPYGHSLDWNQTEITTETDSIWCNDRSFSCAIDNDGVVHVAFGLSCFAPVPSSGVGYYSYWTYYIDNGTCTNGIVYWNSNYVNEQGGHEIPLYGNWSGDANHTEWASNGTNGVSNTLNSIRLAALAAVDGHTNLNFIVPDENHDGVVNNYDDYWGNRWGNYRTFGMSTMPAISIDENGNMIIAYSTLSETRTGLTANGVDF